MARQTRAEVRPDASTRPRLTRSGVTSWVIKSAVAPGGVHPDWPPGTVRSVLRCVRPSYRLDLMDAGARCLLWISGRHAPGVHAIGTFAAAPEGDPPAVRLELYRLVFPVARAELIDSPGFGRAEVIRMPAGSNPSYLEPAAAMALVDALDEVDRAQAGWG